MTRVSVIQQMCMSQKPWDLAFTADPEEVAALRRMRIHLGVWGLHEVRPFRPSLKRPPIPIRHRSLGSTFARRSEGDLVELAADLTSPDGHLGCVGLTRAEAILSLYSGARPSRVEPVERGRGRRGGDRRHRRPSTGFGCMAATRAKSWTAPVADPNDARVVQAVDPG